MGRWRFAFLGSLGFGCLVACGSMLGIEPDVPAADAGPSDASAEGSSEASATDAPEGGPCNLAAPFGAPTLIVENTTAHGGATLSEDELTILVDTLVPGPPAARQAIFVATRQRLVDAFPAGKEITGPVADPSSSNYNAALSQDGLGLVFVSNRSGPGQYRLYKATRTLTTSDFQGPAILGTISNVPTATDLLPFVTTEGDIWFASDRAAVGVQFDLWRSSPVGDGGSYAPPTIAPGDLTTASSEGRAVLSRDGLRIFFASERATTSATGGNIWTATRQNEAADFGAAVVVGELNSAGNDRPTWISPDSCRLYFNRDTSGIDEIFVASRPPN